MNRFDDMYYKMSETNTNYTNGVPTITLDATKLRDAYANVTNYTKYSAPKPLTISKVIFNNPATIVFWSDKTKTIVKAERDEFDPEKGLAMAISKKFLGNHGNYYNTFKKWLPKENTKEDTRWCGNCKHRAKRAYDRPCFGCHLLSPYSSWESEND